MCDTAALGETLYAFTNDFTLAFSGCILNCVLPYGGGEIEAWGLTSELNYGIRTAKWAKAEVTMRFLVENYP